MQTNHARQKLKDVLANAAALKTQYKIDLVNTIVEKKFCEGVTYYPIEKEDRVAKVLKMRDNPKRDKHSWNKLQ
jgi:hypothetical protein